MKTQEQIVRHLESMEETARRQIDGFADKLKGANPAYAMSWSASQFIYAAEFEFATGWLAFFRNDEKHITVGTFLEQVQHSVLERSRNASNKSSSITSNYMDDCVLEVAAEFLAKCRN